MLAGTDVPASAVPPYQRITLPFAASITKAQDEIASGNLEAAEKSLKDAASTGHIFPKNMLLQVQRASTGGNGSAATATCLVRRGGS